MLIIHEFQDTPTTGGGDAALASELSEILDLLTRETNIKLGVALDEDGKFKFLFATNGRASMNYTVSSNLAGKTEYWLRHLSTLAAFDPKPTHIHCFGHLNLRQSTG
jgi:hypothetical protein